MSQGGEHGKSTSMRQETPTYEEDINVGQWGLMKNTGGGSGGGYAPDPIIPKAKKLFTNLKMSDEEWKKLEDMLDELTDDCMGGAFV